MSIKRIILLVALHIFLVGNAQEKRFTQAALLDTLIDTQGNRVTFASVLKKHEGKPVFIDIWATWCRDCLVAMPQLHELMDDAKKVDFVFISLDRNQDSWRKGIEKYDLGQREHYFSVEGWKSDLFSSIDLDWIPRYMIIGPDGKIELFKAIKLDDIELKRIIDLNHKK
ncbi:redoxin family protein [Flavobacteriaceae bacterium F89]|uniref:Redoxin family protein n=1 Tax=Cerina litoralis TaxID=2874477 RepID=A0AAE3ESN2_9FLAO|nr:thioredoxin-like domain-containing protein [Cerina litoralis]MCG2459715.1 redoxin family protein [Cerina litoralis]